MVRSPEARSQEPEYKETLELLSARTAPDFDPGLSRSGIFLLVLAPGFRHLPGSWLPSSILSENFHPFSTFSLDPVRFVRVMFH